MTALGIDKEEDMAEKRKTRPRDRVDRITSVGRR
jgi:hypothetical protein